MKEYETKYCGLKIEKNSTSKYSKIYEPKDVGGEPESVDHRSMMPPIKDQGTCGSCWAFAAVASLEFAYNLSTKN